MILTNRKENEGVLNAIISQVQEMIGQEDFKAGDRLPSETSLAKRFGVSRRNLSQALQKLEFYGLLESKPKSGTFLADLGSVALHGMIQDILALEAPDFKSLIETRMVLEYATVQFAAERRSIENLARIKVTLEDFKAKILAGEPSLQQDLLFHLAIAKASTNSVLSILMLLITPEIIGSYDQDRVCEGDEAISEVKKHEDIYLAIKDSNPTLAKEKMYVHFTRLRAFLDAPE